MYYCFKIDEHGNALHKNPIWTRADHHNDAMAIFSKRTLAGGLEEFYAYVVVQSDVKPSAIEADLDHGKNVDWDYWVYTKNFEQMGEGAPPFVL